MKVCGNVVLPYFWCSFAENFILTYSISVLLDYGVCGLKKVWVTVISDREVSAVLRFQWDPLVRFFSFFSQSKRSVSSFSYCNSLHSQGPLLYKQALRF